VWHAAIGLHFLGPNAGEVMQGFAVAFQKGLTREHLEHAIAIHSSVAEALLFGRYHEGRPTHYHACALA